MLVKTFHISHKPDQQHWKWFSKTIQRQFLNHEDFEGYSNSTLIALCIEIDEEIGFINRCIFSTQKRKGAIKVIYKSEKQLAIEVRRLKKRRKMLIETKEWATLALHKARRDNAIEQHDKLFANWDGKLWLQQ